MNPHELQFTRSDLNLGIRIGFGVGLVVGFSYGAVLTWILL